MKKTNRIRLTESDLHRIVKESVKRVLKEEIDFENTDTFYKVDIHEPNSDEDVDNEFFDNEDDAYNYAKQKCYNAKLQADIYAFNDDWADVRSESDLAYCDWNWIDCVGFVDGQLNQF